LSSQIADLVDRLVVALNERGIAHAFVGDVAVLCHGVRKIPTEVEMLLRRENFTEFEAVSRDVGLQQSSKQERRFRDQLGTVRLTVLFPDFHPGLAYRGPIKYADPLEGIETLDGPRVIGLQQLIELKLASRRFCDLADVSALIRVHHLNDEYRHRLHPSVRDAYLSCWTENERDDAFHALNSAQEG